MDITSSKSASVKTKVSISVSQDNVVTGTWQDFVTVDNVETAITAVNTLTIPDVYQADIVAVLNPTIQNLFGNQF